MERFRPSGRQREPPFFSPRYGADGQRVCGGGPGAETLHERFADAGPRQVFDCDAPHLRAVDELADALELWAARLIWTQDELGSAEILQRIEQLVMAKKRVDVCLRERVSLRKSFAAVESSPSRRAQLRHYLRIVSRTIDLSGRLRYLIRDAIDSATYVLESTPTSFHQLIDLLTRHRVQTGAEVLAYVLFDPLPGAGSHPFPDETKERVLRLIDAVHVPSSMADLCSVCRNRGSRGT